MSGATLFFALAFPDIFLRILFSNSFSFYHLHAWYDSFANTSGSYLGRSLGRCLCWSHVCGKQNAFQIFPLSWFETLCHYTSERQSHVCFGCSTLAHFWYPCRRLGEKKGALWRSCGLPLSFYFDWSRHSFRSILKVGRLRKSTWATRCCDTWIGAVQASASNWND